METLHVSKNVKAVLKVKLSRSKVAAEELQTHKDNACDESHPTRSSILGGEVWLQMSNSLDVLLQRELLLLVHLSAGEVSMCAHLDNALFVR